MTDDNEQSPRMTSNEEVLPAAPDVAEAADEELARCRQETKANLDGWQRERAEFMNYKKDEAKRAEFMAEHAAASLIRELLPVADSLDLAVKQNGGGEEGFSLIRTQFIEALERNGVRTIPVKPGEAFNPEIHEALEEVDSDAPPGAIAEVVQKGYLLDAIVIRPARVKISKPPH